jgi:hypothetical protein
VRLICNEIIAICQTTLKDLQEEKHRGDQRDTVKTLKSIYLAIKRFGISFETVFARAF